MQRVKFLLPWLLAGIVISILLAWALPYAASDSDATHLPNFGGTATVQVKTIPTPVGFKGSPAASDLYKYDANGNVVYAETTTVVISSDTAEDEVQCVGLPNKYDSRYVVSYGQDDSGNSVVECPVLNK